MPFYFISVAILAQVLAQQIHKKPGSFFGEGAMDVKLFIGIMMIDRLVSVTAYGHGGGGHGGHSSGGHSSRWHSSVGTHIGGRGGGGSDEGGSFLSALLGVLIWLLLSLVLSYLCKAVAWIICQIYGRVVHAYAGDSHHGYLVVPRILCCLCCGQPHLNTPWFGPQHKHQYCGNHVAFLANGTYVRAVFSRVDEDAFPPRAEFSFLTQGPAGTIEHQRLLEVEGGISGTCLLSAEDMYDGQHCQVAPVAYVGFAPATLEDVRHLLRPPDP